MFLYLFLNSKYFSKYFHFPVLGTWNFFAISTVPLYRLLIYLPVTTAQWNFLHSFLSSIPRNVFWFILKFKIFFEKLALFRVRNFYFAISTVLLYRLFQKSFFFLVGDRNFLLLIFSFYGYTDRKNIYI